MTPEQLALARHRLWLGITNVGFWVLATTVGLYWLTCFDTSGFNLRRLGLTVAAALVVQSVFDRQERTTVPRRNALVLGGLNHGEDFQFGLRF